VCTNILSKKSRSGDHLTWKVIGMEFYHNSENREGYFFLSRSWKPHIHSMKERQKKVFARDRTVTSSSGNTPCMCPSPHKWAGSPSSVPITCCHEKGCLFLILYCPLCDKYWLLKGCSHFLCTVPVGTVKLLFLGVLQIFFATCLDISYHVVPNCL
jgi:hypothetical protein